MRILGKISWLARSATKMKKPTKNLSLTTQTIRNLQTDALARVTGGSISVQSGTIINPSGGVTSLLGGTSINPSGGRL